MFKFVHSREFKKNYKRLLELKAEVNDVTIPKDTYYAQSKSKKIIQIGLFNEIYR